MQTGGLLGGHGVGGGHAAWRILGFFWAGLIALLVAVGGALQGLGPPAAVDPPLVVHPQIASRPAVHASAAPVLRAPEARHPIVPAAIAAVPMRPRPPGSPIPAPDASQADASTNDPRAYAGGWDPADPRKRVAILLVDIGLSAHDSDAAIDGLPAAISFGLSPYAPMRPGQLAKIRAAGHETLVSIPMEPSGFGLADPGPRALLTSATPAQNAEQLRRTLDQFTGYVGVTGALGMQHGERFAGSSQMADLLDRLAGRGLLYIDPRPGGQLPAIDRASASRAIDLVLDDRAATRAEIDARLDRLAARARRTGSALGLASAPSPLLRERLAQWAAGLAGRDLVLVPVSALAVMHPVRVP